MVTETLAWLFDILPQKDNIIMWWITDKKKTIKCYHKQVNASIYAHSNISDRLLNMAKGVQSHPLVSDVRFVKKRVSIHHKHPSDVLEILIPLYINKQIFMREIRDIFPVSFFNIDLSNFQYFFQMTGLFPFCKAKISYDEHHYIQSIVLQDKLTQFSYDLPPVKAVQIDINFRHALKRNAIWSISFTSLDSKLDEDNRNSTSNRIIFRSTVESQLILQAIQWIDKHEIDVLVTHGGDTDLRFLAKRAVVNGLGHLSLSREKNIDQLYRAARHLDKPKGTSFMSYGGHFYKAHGYYLYGGRHHIDLRNSFTWNDGGFAGVVELARLSCIDAQRCARTTIGTTLTGMQIRQALTWNILIPSRKADAERFRSGETLIVGDRGGFIYSPRVGLHFNVAAIDFSSMFPNIMVKHNISPETVNCNCCTDGSGKPIPGTSWHTCQERKGLVPLVLKTVLEKRLFYKKFKKTNKSYDQLQKTLKWILVTCFEENTLLPVYDNKILKLVRIGTFVERLLENKAKYSDFAVVGLNSSFKSILNPIKRAYKLHSPKTLLHIQLETGREITLTADHKCYRLANNKLEEIEAKDLNAGDFVPFLNTLPKTKFQKEINAIPILLKTSTDEDLDKWRVWGDSISDYIALNKHKLKETIVKHHSISSIRNWINKSLIPLKYIRILDIPTQEYKKYKISYGRRVGGKLNCLPACFRIDEEIGFFLGYFIGDGSACETFLRLSIHEEDLDLIKWFQSFAERRLDLKVTARKEPHTKMYTLQFNSAGFIRVLTEVMGVERTASRGKLKIPYVILNGDDKTIYWFFGGLLASDGSIHPNKNVMRITSANFSFIEELGYLATRIGLYHTFSKSQPKNGRTTWDIILSGTETINKLIENSYIKEMDLKKFNKKQLNKSSRSYGLDFPIIKTDLVEIAKKVRKTRNRQETQQERVPRKIANMKLKQIYESADKLNSSEERKLRQIECIISGNTGFVKVISITERPATSKFVYCLEVENQLPGLIAGTGGIFTHNCFGYQGYRNARFGRIEAHEAINAYARYSLLVAGESMQRQGFEIVAGIVDSLYGKLSNEQIIESAVVQEICQEIEEVTELPIDHEGTFKWVVFLPRRHEPEVGVLNRYYGCFEDGSFKVRGIELRRRDTCQFIKTAQAEALEVLSSATTKEEFYALLIGQYRTVHEKYDAMLRNREVPAKDLFIKKVIAKEPSQYAMAVHQAIAAKQLARAGVHLQSGMKVSFLVTNSTAKSTNKRVIASDLYRGQQPYDVKWYQKMLKEALDNIIPPTFTPRPTTSLKLERFTNIASTDYITKIR